VWWKYYPNLAEYIARCSYLLRQGDFQADIALYSPLANQWAINVINPRKWTREFDWGELGGLIVSNGYDYDLLNDDVLQNHATIEAGNIAVQKMDYKLLIIPNVETIPLKTLEFIEKYVRQGGRVLFLERLPEKSTGLKNAVEMDAKVKDIVSQLFNEPVASEPTGKSLYGIKEQKNDPTIGFAFGRGKVYRLNNVIDRQIWWNKQSSYLDPFLKILHNRIAPDFGIDFMNEGMRKNEGLAFIHRKIGKSELYFISNIQNKSSSIPITFRTHNQQIRRWNPYTGSISQVFLFEETADGIKVPLELAPYESMFLEFAPGNTATYVSKTDFSRILAVGQSTITAETSCNGRFQTTLVKNGQSSGLTSTITDIPAPFTISGTWNLRLQVKDFPLYEKTLDHLVSWSDDAATKNFSGTGSYDINFTLPDNWLRKDQRILLDLGRIGNIAEVYINGKEAGIVWMRGQQPEITAWLKKGENNLKILVTNTLINRIAAMKEPAPIPDYLVPRYGSKDKQNEIPREFGFTPLPASGLLGPVRLLPVRKIVIPQ
jgi:hypothetical protein